MAVIEGIFSIRLVISDFYMGKPVQGLDPVYSEFRGKEIKKVPIIRVFGSNAEGQKTCMHIHGVFPYFYVPYDQKDFDSVNKAIYQMAINLDKAINISLSQGSSGVQHVFKVQVVKGIPFYGYHRSDHLYLKIYMFNPRFVRRAAGLLQNGAIMNKNFHPHEAHVPYVLQFMIDYNLYGMSFIHIPLEIIKFRRSDISEQIPFKNMRGSQILDHNVAKRLSCSTLEIDIGSNFILNRFQLVAKTSTTHTNPGIESIWNDEKLRRQKMAQVLDEEEQLNTIPPLEVPPTQDRPGVYPTESENFYRTALVSKLTSLETALMGSSQTSDQTINCTFQSNMTNVTLSNSLNAINRNQKRTFNLSRILQNSVYPEECTQNENFVNASFVENHLSNNNEFEQSVQVNMSLAVDSEDTITPEDSTVFLDDTVVDEELVLSVTQSHVPLDATLRNEDLELLDILQQLEEDNNDSKIDLDSSLAPLSQNNKNYALSPEFSQKKPTASVMEPHSTYVDGDDENVDEDNIHDFSIALENFDDLILKLTQSQINTDESNAPHINSPTQIDGSDDLLKTPTKPSTSSSINITSPRTPTSKKTRRVSQASPSRSPRTPKSGHKYKPLPLIITNRSSGKKIISDLSAEKTPSKTSVIDRENNSRSVFLRKEVALYELRRKSISIEADPHDGPNDLPSKTHANTRRSKRFKDLDKTHVTCNLTPRRTNEKLLKVYNVDEHNKQDLDSANPKANQTRDSILKLSTEHQSNSIHITESNKHQDDKKTGDFVAYEEDDDEVVESDDEPTLRLKKTPNLKRLRRSFLFSRSFKRSKVEAKHDNVINSSKFENQNLNICTSNPTDEFATNSSKKIGDPTKLDNLSASSEQPETRNVSDNVAKIPSELEVIKCCEKLVTIPESIPVTNLNNKHIKHLEKNTKIENSKNIQTVEKVLRDNCKPGSKIVNEVRRTITDDNKTYFSEQNVRTTNFCNEPSDSIIYNSSSDVDINLPFVSNPYRESLNSDSLEVHSPHYSGDILEVCIGPSSKSSNCDSNKDRNRGNPQSIKFNIQSVKNVRVMLKKLGNKNLEVIKKDSFQASEENVKNHSPKAAAAINYDQASETTKVKLYNEYEITQKRKYILDNTGKNLTPLDTADHTENLLKSLLKLQGTVRTEIPTNFESSDVTSILPSFEHSSQSSSKDLFQESPAMLHSSDDEIAETPPHCDNNDSNPSRVYEKSVMLQSPLLFTQNLSQNIIPPNHIFQNSKPNSLSDLKEPDIVSVSSSNGTNENFKQAASPSTDSSIVLTPLDLPPTRDEVLKGCIKLNLPEYEFQQPYYSNPEDITKQKEIGFTILQIQGNKLNDLEEFQSIFGQDIKGLAAWRRTHLLRLGGPEMLNKCRNTQRIREYFADHKTVSITPHINAPTRQEVKVWLKARELLKNKGEHLDENGDTIKRLTDEDSPIKVRRQKVTMMLNNESGEDCESSLDCSTRSLTLTPLTPATPLAIDCLKDRDKKMFTPVTTKFEKIPLERVNSPYRKRNNRRVLKRVSLNQKIKEALEKANASPVAAPNSQERKIIPASDKSILPNSQTSETSSVSSPTALAEMQHSSVKDQIQQHDVTIGVLKQVSLNQKIKEALENANPSPVVAQNSQESKIIPASDKNILPNSQTSETSSVSSQTALAEMQHSSVKDQIQQHDVTIGVLKQVLLNQKIKEALENANPSPVVAQNSQESKIIPASDKNILPNSQTSETSSVSSQTALAEMERSSFMEQIQQHDVTIGFSNNNSTLNNTFGFKVALENLQQAKADIEVFVATRDDLFPNPQIDEIRCLFYAIDNSIPNDHIDIDKKLPRTSCGYIMVHDSRDIVAKEGSIHGIDRDIAVTIVQTEVEALEALLGLCSRWDPDIYAGYEIEMSSWGFVIERAKYLCLNIAPLLSRVPSQKTRDFVDEDREQFTDLDVEMKLCGRILLDVWRLMRSEIALTSYTFENVMYHIMHKRCPWHSYRTLTEWFNSRCSRWIVIEYYLERVRGTLGLLDQLDLIGRTSEMAKLIGIQFYEVLSRGSQFRVESMMLRISKPKNLVPLSPSVQQRAHMRAPEYLPLILEPQSRFYADPLIVLDFQSLYPSMIIGYNYCFSTCLGRVEHLGQSTPFEFGASHLRVSPSMLRKLVDRDLITISPCGVVFVKSSVREGILPRMLTEILDTRQMVKQSMKVHKKNSALQRILHSRQLGLKLMANTTYGYTAANFSGRMPAVEVGDSVVAKGRETLERAIKMVEANDKWNVKVVYGDTDSMFVLVPGRNREEAFRIGQEIADAVTKQNPQPVKLKLEKVYQPCILQTKKRYVGYMYETPDQKEPVYEAKGIETVRRDGCPIVAKMLEKVLRILFESADVSQVKQYVCRQFTKVLSGRANLQDLIFAKEFRGINGYKANACVPALELTRKWIQTDPRRIPRRGERVPFIITNGPPGVPLIRLIRHPHEVLGDDGLKINAIYYITKAIIPPLNRCLLLLGADVNDWFANLPRKILMTPALSIANEVIPCPNIKSKKSTISQFFSTTNCVTDCGHHTKRGICMECSQKPLRSMVILQMKISKIERGFLSTQQICQSCCGRLGDLKCGSLDCPVLYVLHVKRRDLQQIAHFRNLLEDTF